MAATTTLTPTDSSPLRPAPRNRRWLAVAVAVVPVLLYGAYYLRYATSGWFQGDDFGLRGYYRGLHLGQLVSDSNFGRFVSRNLYWFVADRVLGARPVAYFVVDLLVVVATSALIFWLVRRRAGAFIGIVAGFVYLSAPAVFANYVWIANEQHLLADLFFFAFVVLYVHWDMAPRRWAQVAALTGVFLAGLYSNLYAGSVILLPLLVIALRPEERRNRKQLVLAGMGLAFTVNMAARLHTVATGVYSVAWSPHVFQRNVSSYFGPWVWLLVAVILAGTVSGIRRRDVLRAWLFLGSVAAYLPFAFLVYQRYTSYLSLSYTLFTVGVLTVVCDVIGESPRRRMTLALGSLALLAALQLPMPFRSSAYSWPAGRTAHALVTDLARYQSAHSALSRYCFMGAPTLWWHVASGDAFRQFDGPTASYRYLPAGGSATGCQVQALMEPSGLRLP